MLGRFHFAKFVLNKGIDELGFLRHLFVTKIEFKDYIKPKNKVSIR